MQRGADVNIAGIEIEQRFQQLRQALTLVYEAKKCGSCNINGSIAAVTSMVFFFEYHINSDNTNAVPPRVRAHAEMHDILHLFENCTATCCQFESSKVREI
jgi:hypothetical protein